MRTFLAVAPSEGMARDIHSAYEAFRNAWTGVKWVNPLQYHITLAFLGEIESHQVKKVTETLGPILSQIKVFNISFGGLGHFGSDCCPSLFFLEVGSGSGKLEMIRRNIRPELDKISLWEERPYKPHLTLGRPRRRAAEGPEGGSLLPPGMKRDNVGVFRAGEVALYKSILRPGGAEYSILESWPLKEAL